MGTFTDYTGMTDVPENQCAKYARQMLGRLHAGGMMSVDEVGLFSHCIRLLYPPELDETGRAWGCYNYFENNFWESWGLNADKGTFSSNKIGGGAFRTAVLAGYVLTALYSQSYPVAKNSVFNQYSIYPKRGEKFRLGMQFTSTVQAQKAMNALEDGTKTLKDFANTFDTTPNLTRKQISECL